jgi:hypothetical protein
MAEHQDFTLAVYTAGIAPPWKPVTLLQRNIAGLGFDKACGVF